MFYVLLKKNKMKKLKQGLKILLISGVFIFSYNLYSQDLYVAYWNNDQKDEYIKNVEIHDIEGIRKEKKVKAKSQIQLIKIYNDKGYEVFKIHSDAFPNGALIRYHIWFREKKDKKENK